MHHEAVRLAIILLVGCGFQGKPVGGDDDDDGGMQTIVDDTAADFGAGVLDEAAIDPNGLVEPGAYVLGGLHATGYNLKLFDTTNTTYDSIAPALAAGTVLGTGYAQIPDDWGMARPFGLGLPANSDGFTIAYDGELHLTAGTHAIGFVADDAGIVELDLGSGFQPLAEIPPSVPRDGWYPIRAAIAEGTGNAKLVIQVDGAKLAAGALRAPVNAARGMLVSAYSNTMTGPMLRQSAIAVPIVDHDFASAAPPYDVAMLVADTYFLRFAGQIYIAAAGSHAFAAATPGSYDTATVWVDRHAIARTGMPGTVALDPGWHGFAVDFTSGQANNPHDASLAVTLDGQPIATTALRPAATTGTWLQLFSTKIMLNDQNQMGGATALPLPIPPALPPSPLGVPQTIDAMDFGWFEGGGTATDYTATAVLGTTPAFALPMLALLNGFYGSFILGDEHLRDQPLVGPWTIQVMDGSQGGGQATASAYAAVTLHGGPAMPFAPHWVYTSAQHPTPGASALGAITVTSSDDGATIALEVRTTPDDSAWVTVANGATPMTEAGDFIQYRITVDGDGWQFPTIDKVAIDFVAPAP